MFTALILIAKDFALPPCWYLVSGICATLNLHIQALKLNQTKAEYSFEGCYFGTIMRSGENQMQACTKIPVYTVLLSYSYVSDLVYTPEL